jgi:hypothetical protein
MSKHKVYENNPHSLWEHKKENIQQETLSFKDNYFTVWEPGSSVSIVSGYGLDDQVIEVRSLAEPKNFSSTLCVQTSSGAHPASCPLGNRGPSPGGKTRPGHDADRSPPSSAEVVNEYELYLVSPQAPPRCVAGLLYFTLLHCMSKNIYSRYETYREAEGWHLKTLLWTKVDRTVAGKQASISFSCSAMQEACCNTVWD